MSTRYNNVCLHSFGYALPPHSISSEALEDRLEPVYRRLKLPRGRLEMMSGIKERRFWDKGTRPSSAAVRAGEDALERSKVAPQDIQCLIFTSVSRDMMEPATASFVHHALGLPEECLVFDISNACLGFLDGIIMLANMIELGQVDNGLLVSGETAEELLESTVEMLNTNSSITRKSIKPIFASLTIGSGSVALYMTRNDTCSEPKPTLKYGAWRANTTHSNLCQGSAEGHDTTLMYTNSEELLIQGVETAKLTWQQFTRISGWPTEEVDRFFCHQVGSAHAKLLFEKLGLDPRKNYETLPFLGNVGSVSAPITLAMAIDNELFTPGMKGAMLGIGSGINCLMLGIEW
ncbi:MAG: 3-oxoacyl-ACP synthase III [Desulfobulbaceae bacterium]|nr:MAG: 3-oxoacyl-ACP synthase III [Desulfobulbaceae bacterium]